jgi:fatty acid desaturase
VLLGADDPGKRSREEAAMDPRAQARQRLQAKRRFQRHALIYAVVIGLLVVIWALTNLGNYFWPIWPALLWGIALAIHAWTVYGQRPITDADIDRELGRNHRPDQPAGG